MISNNNNYNNNNNNIYNLLSRINKRDTVKDLITLNSFNDFIISLLVDLEKNGFLKFNIDYYKKVLYIHTIKIKHISAISKPSRRIFSNLVPYTLNTGLYITKSHSNEKGKGNHLELILKVL